jgi:hypothetical protein
MTVLMRDSAPLVFALEEESLVAELDSRVLAHDLVVEYLVVGED